MTIYTISLEKGKRKLFNVYEHGRFVGQARLVERRNGQSYMLSTSGYIYSLPLQYRYEIEYLLREKLNSF